MDLSNIIIQIILSVLSLSSLFCITRESITVRKYAPIFGLLSQPFWIYATFKASQFGMFLLSFIYTIIWVNTFYNMWINKKGIN